ncbi:MAG: hypothetical protein K8W52_18315, partial [Deltaproteobacteria bacterium]|nr:hypothetical protein [Deltaproteobacteria bacterium]
MSDEAAPAVGAPIAPTDVRLPLQIGTTATWAAARTALALFPGLAMAVVTVQALIADLGDATVIPGALCVLLLVYAGFYVRLAVRARASDLVCTTEAVAIDGGPHGGTRIAWTELTPPYAVVESAKEERLVLWRLPITAVLMLGGEGDPTEKIPVWRLAVWRGGTRLVLAESDRAIEAESMRAAVATIEAVVSGRRFVAEAAQLPTEFARCPACGAALVPADAAEVTCAYCRATAPLPPAVRAQAQAGQQLARSRGRTARRIARLRRQPRASMINLRIAAWAVLMIGAWPLGWGLVGARVWRLGFHAIDLAAFLLPLAAVFAGFFLARARLVDRRALQLLTLAFGALAPAHVG